MLPFSRRPPPPEEYFLRSGDFQAVQAPPSYANQIQPAPRAPVFARQAAHTPYGFSQRQQHQQQGHYGDLSVPPPPHSLAPVAMGSSTNAAATGSHSHRVQPAVTIREKPSLKWGVMIALTGALLGGVLGLGMDAKRQQARAAAQADARENAPLTVTALPTVAAVVAVNGLNVVPASAINPTLAGAPAARPAAVLPTSAPLTVTSAPAKPEPVAKNDKHVKPAPAAKHTGFVAVKIPKPAPEKAEPVAAKPEKPEPAPKPEKAAKSEKADSGEKAAPTKSSADARKVLEDAIKDTTNTL